MSTRIYTAYRLKDPTTFEEWLADTKRTAIENAYQCYKQEMIRLLGDLSIKDGAIYDIVSLKHHEIMSEYKKVGSQLERCHFDFDVELWINMYRGNVYLRPYPTDRSIMASTWHFLQTDEAVEEYGYWNNVDHPEEISEDEWIDRGTVWNSMLGACYEDRCPTVSLNIVEWRTYYLVLDNHRLSEELQENT